MMSYVVGGKLAGREAGYFIEESRQVVSRYLEKNASKTAPRPVDDDSLAAHGLNPLHQLTFGPERRKLGLPEVGRSGSVPSRHDQHPPLDHLEKIKAAGEGLDHVGIGKVFAGATSIAFATAALTFGLAASSLQGNDIGVKGRDFVQPKVESLKDGLDPLRNWVDESSKKWHLQTESYLKEKPLIKELSKKFRAEQKAKSSVK